MPGLFFEQFEVGAAIEHASVHRITQEQNAAFCALTLNNQPLHLDPAAAAKGPFGKLLVNGLLTFSLAVGMSVRDLTEGTLVANVAYSQVEHPAPVFPGDTIVARSTVVSKRSSSKPGRGLVEVQTEAKNQDGAVVCRFRRAILVRTREAAA